MGKNITWSIKWNSTALYSFIDILDFIKEKSPVNAKRVKTRINNIIKSIPSNPEMFREDELKENNDGTYRVFNKDSIRVSYKIEANTIFIVKVIHTSKETRLY